MRSDEPKTIIGFKIKGSRTTKEIVQGLLLLVALFVGLALFGLVQVKLCQDKYPKKTWQQCLKGRR